MNINIFWFAGVLILNNVLVGYAIYRLWNWLQDNNFGLHIVPCDNCDAVHLAPYYIKSLIDCESCHVCETCGKYMFCKTCGRKELVRQDVVSIDFCDSDGCFEAFQKKRDNLSRLEKKRKKIEGAK